VAGQGALDVMHIKVGQWVRVVAAGAPHILHIVGRSIEPDHNGETLSVGLDTLDGPSGPPQPQYYALTLRPGAVPGAVKADVLRASHGRVEVQSVTDPADGLGTVRMAAAGLIALLVLIGLTELFTTTSLSLREHTRDIGVLRTIGLTPRQITAIIITSTALLAAAAVVTGSLLGIAVSDWLINLQGAASGMGAGIAQPPPPAVLLLSGTLAIALAAAFCALPAARAARAPVTRMLSTV
jgi:putative ABC transport system permease protein